MPDHSRIKANEPHAGELVDLARFARVRWWTGTERHDLRVHEIQPDADGRWRPARDPETGEWHIGLEWAAPRDVRQVMVHYADAGSIPPGLRVQYWRNNWPTPAPERRTGARRGWIGSDDPWHGGWTTVRAVKSIDGATCLFNFDPIDLPELGGRQASAQLEEAEHYLARFRRTLKLRLVSGGEEQPLIAGVHAYSTTRWQEGRVDVRFCAGREPLRDWSGSAQATNGYVLSVEPLDLSADRVDADGSWQCRVGDRSKGVRLSVLYTDCDPAGADRTLITVRTQARTFSFRVSDLNLGPIYIADYDVYITWAETDIPFDTFGAQLAIAPKSIYDRVPDEPEHSLARAMSEIPPLDVAKQVAYMELGRYVPLGVDAGRQEFALRHNGELFADKRQLKLAGRDAARLLWPGHQIRYRFGTGDPPDFERVGMARQSVRDGWLPVVTTHWLDREIEYAQTAFVGLLDRPMTEPEDRRGDEPVVAMLRFVIRNTTHGRKRAHLWLAIAPQEQIELAERLPGPQPVVSSRSTNGLREDGLVIATGRIVPADPVAREWRVDPYERACLRCAVNTGGRGSLATAVYAEEGASQAVPTAVRYTVDLDGGEEHAITIAVPFVSLTDEGAWQRAAGLDYDALLADVVAYWRGYVEAGGLLDVPDRVLADFHKAARVHVAISADIDPASGLIVVPAATWSYGACGNEACWQIAMLDQAGHHRRAEAYLWTFLRTQGTVRPDGLFSSAEGALQGMDLDDGKPVMGSFAYNLDHGVIMECLANHYSLTGDREWLERVAPHLVAACELVVRERASTKVRDADGHPLPEWGLLPAGHLEDNREWRHWFAVNAHAYAGMRAIADALADVGHPQAGRLAAEAAAYREDIRQAAHRAMVESPVVRLLDGTYVPHVPTRTSIRGREGGWFREAAYGALHLLEGGVFDLHEEEMTWVLKDLEDNLFVSREWGRPVQERYWFSHGGVTIQPNLMDLGIDYLRRGQVKHALRALFNNFGVSLYPDVRVFAEHPVIELGHGVGPFYKASDESKALIWLRAFLLWEKGDTLHLAMGAPRAWFAPGQSFRVREMATRFGPLTYRVQSGPAEIVVEIDVPDRRPPQELLVHLRRAQGQTMRTVTVNGEAHEDFSPTSEVVRIAAPSGTLTIRASC